MLFFSGPMLQDPNGPIRLNTPFAAVHIYDANAEHAAQQQEPSGDEKKVLQNIFNKNKVFGGKGQKDDADAGAGVRSMQEDVKEQENAASDVYEQTPTLICRYVRRTVYAYTHTYVCVCVCVYAHTLTYTHTHASGVRMHTDMYRCVRMRTRTHRHVQTHTCMHTSIHSYTCTYIMITERSHKHTYTNT
jgi:hypothetical protein